MQAFPSEMQSLQVQIMKLETLTFDNDRLCSTLKQRISELPKGDGSDTVSVRQLDQFDKRMLEFAARVDQAEYSQQNLTNMISEHSKIMRAIDMRHNSLLKEMQRINQKVEKNQKDIAEKVSFDIFNEELNITKAISLKQQPQQQQQKSHGIQIQTKLPAAKPAVPGGMTAQQKAQLSDLTEEVERISSVLRS